eukprot:1150293-Pelagomonas_calceolata.AAC.2
MSRDGRLFQERCERKGFSRDMLSFTVGFDPQPGRLAAQFASLCQLSGELPWLRERASTKTSPVQFQEIGLPERVVDHHD